MAHYAELDENNKVLRVCVVGDYYEADGEAAGIKWCEDFWGGRWIKTSYNGSIRKNFAGPGYIYDPELDIFIPPSPFKFWIFDRTKLMWKCPAEKPADPSPNQTWVWDDNLGNWARIYKVIPPDREP